LARSTPRRAGPGPKGGGGGAPARRTARVGGGGAARPAYGSKSDTRNRKPPNKLLT